MTTSASYGFDPEIAELCDEAFERCGIDPETLTSRHVRSARRSIDLMLTSDWANKGVFLWAVEQVSLPLIVGTATYTLAQETNFLLDVVLRNADGIDTIVTPMARDEYLAVPDKSSQGFPSRYYLDRQKTPTLTLWQTPAVADTLIYTRMRRLQKSGAASNTVDVPERWLEAFTAGLAAKLAEKFAPDREGALFDKYSAAFKRARDEDDQKTPTRFRVRFR